MKTSIHLKKQQKTEAGKRRFNQSGIILLFSFFFCSAAFSQVTKNEKQPAVSHKGTITSEIKDAITNNTSAANPVTVFVRQIKSASKLYAVISEGKVLRFESKDSKGKPLTTSMQRTSNQNSTSLICSVCIREKDGTSECYEVDCSLILKLPEKKIQ